MSIHDDDARIPFAPVYALMSDYMLAYDLSADEFARQADVSKHWMDGACRSNRRPKTVAFNLADKLLCAMNLTTAWHSDPELAEIYQTVDLTDKAPEVWDVGEARGPYSCGHERTVENSIRRSVNGGAAFFRCRLCVNGKHAAYMRKRRAAA